MDYAPAVLGEYQSHKLQERTRGIVLQIGSDVFTRADLAKVECFSYVAAANLSAALTKELRAKSTRDVFERIAPQDVALPRVGVVAFAVLGAAFEAKGLGGDRPLERWVEAHSEKVVTVDTFKAREQRAAVKARKQEARSRRKRPPVAPAEKGA